MKQDEELKQSFKVFVDENEIINLIFLREEIEPEIIIREAELIEQSIQEVFNKNLQKIYNGIVDFSPLGDKIIYVGKEAREVYSRILFHSQVKNIAMISSNKLYEMLVNLILQAIGKNRSLKWFTNKEDALRWLEEKK